MIAARATTLSLVAVVVLACDRAAEPAPVAAVPDSSGHLYVWTGDADAADADFLAVIDVRRGSPTYATVIRTVPVEGRGNVPHHTEYDLSASTLMANGWNTGRTFAFDLTRPDSPFVRSTFTAAGGFTYPHSYARLPNGNVLATFQSRTGAYAPPGGLVELDDSGNVVRSASAASPAMPSEDTWPYSILVLPDLDRVVLTHTRMGLVSEWLQLPDTAGAHAHDVGVDSKSPYVQVWKLSDLTLLSTLRLPPQDGGHNEYVAEPRRMPDGTVFVNTFSCGIYRIDGITTDAPSIAPVMSSKFEANGYCAVPVVVGKFWIQPSATEQAVVAYDLSDPGNPREVSRVTITAPLSGPHWLAADPRASRIVVTADAPTAWVMLIDVNPATGALAIDQTFRDAGAAHAGVTFDRATWPHGATGKAMPHGAVFGR